MIVLLALPQTLPATAAAEPTAKLDTLRSRISTLREQMRATGGEKTELSDLLQQAEQQIGRRARKLRVLGGRLERQREHLEVLLQEQVVQAGALARQRAALSQQVRAAYAMGRQERIKILLNQQDPATISRVMVYYDYLGKARARRMQLISDQLERLAATEREIRGEQARLAGLREDQQRELEAMEAIQEQRRLVVAQLTRDLNDQSRQLDRLQADERDLTALISGLKEVLADIPARDPQQQRFAGLRGRLPWPANGRIVSRFNTPKLGSLRWDGVMIAAPEGHEVRAVHHGRVAFADWLRGFGLLLIVDHGDGYMTLYGHNQSLFKEAGDWVEVNEPVALVGSSGGRERSGVYFGIRHQGRAVDPAQWCRRPTGSKVG